MSAGPYPAAAYRTGPTARGLAALAIILCGSVSARALEMRVEPEFPVRGQPARIIVTEGERPLPGAAVHAVYRPNSEVSAEAFLGTTDSLGILPWVPASSGLATLRGETADASVSLSVSVRFPRAPWAGLLIFFSAGIILFGGSVRLIAQVLRGTR